MRRTWACGTGGSRRERNHSITPGDARTSANRTCGVSARLVDLYSSYMCDFFLFRLFDAVSICFLPAIDDIIGEPGMGPAPVIFLGS